MITHLHVRLQLPDTDTYRDVVLPDSILLNDINYIISICFGWPFTDAYEFVPQQTHISYVGDTDSFCGIRQSISAEDIALNFAFQKNRELRYYRGENGCDQVSVTLLTNKSLLPTPAFQLNDWHGENIPCTRGGNLFMKQKVMDELLELQEELYLTPDEFDYERAAIDPGYIDELNDYSWLNDALDPEQNPQLKELMEYLATGDIPPEAIMQSSTVAQCLAMVDDEALLELMEFHHLDKTGLSRLQMEEKLLTLLTDEAFITEQLKVLTIPEVEILDFLTQANMPVHSQDIVTHGNYLLRSGLCYFDDSGIFVTAPEELRTMFKKLLKKDDVMMEIQYFDMLHTFCYTAVYLYGIFPMRKLIRIISETMHMVISPDEIREVLKRAAEERFDYVFRDDMIMAGELAEDAPVYHEAVKNLKQLHESRTDFFWPDMDQLEAIIFQRRLANEQLYHQFGNDFFPYLREGNNPLQVLVIMEYWIRSGISLTEVTGLLSLHYFRFFDYDIAKEMADAVIAISEQTPMWSLCGYTPAQEAAKQEKQKTKMAGTKQSAAKAEQSAPSGKTTAKVISLQEHRDKKKNK